MGVGPANGVCADSFGWGLSAPLLNSPFAFTIFSLFLRAIFDREKLRSGTLGFSNSQIRPPIPPSFMFCPTGTMMQGKSSLNADAAPYITISKNSPDGDSTSAKGVSEKSEGVGEAAIRQLHDNVSLEQSLEKLDVSDKSSSVMVQYFETSVAEKQSMTDDTSIVIDFLMSRFPGYCAESLSEFLDFNNGNLEDTIDLLEEFETGPVEHCCPL